MKIAQNPQQFSARLSLSHHFRFFFWILSPAFGMIFAVCAAASDPPLYEARGHRDPFVQLVSVNSTQAAGLIGIDNVAEVTVEGVVYDPGKGSIVIANGLVLKEGEGLGSVKVVKIKPDGVVFSVNGIESFKPMHKEDS